MEQEGTRTVLVNPGGADVQAVHYIRASNARLNALHTLYDRYKGTPHADKILSVFEKSKQIHNYLVSKKRAHELELFHVRNTEHFLNTFTTIINVHQRHVADTFVPEKEQKRASPVAKPLGTPPPQVRPPQPQVRPPQPQVRPRMEQPVNNDGHFESKVENVLKRIEAETIKGIYTAQKVTEMVKRVANQAPIYQPDMLQANTPVLTVPAVALDTYSRVYYSVETEGGGTLSREISYTSPDTEKSTFLHHISSRTGIDLTELSYIGNAMLAIPDNKPPSPPRHVPIIHWRGYPYALSLMDYRMFPVRMHRKSF